jgi:hypothetical protein
VFRFGARDRLGMDVAHIREVKPLQEGVEFYGGEIQPRAAGR